MTTQPIPYVPVQPGDIISAALANALQVQIREDIGEQVGGVRAALDGYIAKPVDAAKFGGETPEEWTKKYDARYVRPADLAAGLGSYRRYFKSLNRELRDGKFEPGLIEHKMGRYPVVTVAELMPLSVLELADVPGDVTPADLRFLVYYANARDRASTRLQTRGNDVAYWGDPITLLLEQFHLEINDTQLFDDVLNDLWEAMFNPGDDQDHFEFAKYGVSAYVQAQIIDRSLSVEQLKRNGQWGDLQVAVRPRVLAVGQNEPAAAAGDQPAHVDVFHITQDMLEIQVTRATDLMVVLRS